MDPDILLENLGITKLKKSSQFIHCDTVGAANLEFLKRKKHFDVTFEVGQEKKKISCHNSFLMSRSPAFETLFSAKFDSSNPISLPNVEPATFELFLGFVYSDEFTTNIPMAIKLLQLGVKYDVKPLVQKCEQLMSEDIQLDDAIETFTIARRYSLQTLMDQAGEILICHFEALSKGSNFRHFDEQTLMYLLKRDELPLEELKLFNIILRWASDNMGDN
ncbi:unnamed protein product [Allacma fusca]|uniref:BTB domain-containing protein n=1 Tax=Allacma fusca TaxID=39272 RepID=A0A8J2NKN3_9HEXA|nr:unnamed protein product [Allacma fusca]